MTIQLSTPAAHLVHLLQANPANLAGALERLAKGDDGQDGAAKDSAAKDSDAKNADASKPDATFLFTCANQGYIEPCG